MKKKAVKTIAILLLVVMILFLVITIPKVMVIQKYSKKLEEYQEVKNFYAKVKLEEAEEEMWRKDNIGITKHIQGDNTRTLYISPNETAMLMETKEGKKASITKIDREDNSFLPVIEYGAFYAENVWQAFVVALGTRMSTEEVNGKECYKMYKQEDFQVFINKEDFLNIKEINGNTSRELIEYQFDTVRDEDVTLPSLEDYEVEEF